MEIIDTKEKYNELVEYIKNSKNITFGRVGFNVGCHNGHIQLISDIKKNSDIVIVDYIEYFKTIINNILGKPVLKGKNVFEEIKQELKDNKDIDYLVYSSIGNTIDYDFVNNLKINNQALEFSSKIGFTKSLLIELICCGFVTPLEEVTKSFVTSKSILQNLVSKKFGSSYNPEFIWKRPKKIEGVLFNKNKFEEELILEKVYDIILEKLNRGVTSKEELEKSMYEYYIKEPRLEIIDLESLQLISNVNNNCVIIFRGSNSSDFIYIKDNEVII